MAEVDQIVATDTGSSATSGPVYVRDAVVAAMAIVGVIAVTDNVTSFYSGNSVLISDIIVSSDVASRNISTSVYDDISVNSTGESTISGAIKIREYVVPNLAVPNPRERIVVDVVSVIEYSPNWFEPQSTIVSDTTYIYDDVGQNNAIAVREEVVVNFVGPTSRERAVYDSIPVTGSVDTEVYDYELTQSVSDSAFIKDVPQTDYYDPELDNSNDNSVGVTESITKKFNAIKISSSSDSILVSDRVIPYLSDHKLVSKSEIDVVIVSDSVNPRYSALFVSVSDTVGITANLDQIAEGGWRYIFRWRF